MTLAAMVITFSLLFACMAPITTSSTIAIGALMSPAIQTWQESASLSAVLVMPFDFGGARQAGKLQTQEIRLASDRQSRGAPTERERTAIATHGAALIERSHWGRAARLYPGVRERDALRMSALIFALR